MGDTVRDGYACLNELDGETDIVQPSNASLAFDVLFAGRERDVEGNDVRGRKLVHAVGFDIGAAKADVLQAARVQAVPVNEDDLFFVFFPVVKPFGVDCVCSVRHFHSPPYQIVLTFGNMFPIFSKQPKQFAGHVSEFLKSMKFQRVENQMEFLDRSRLQNWGP